MPASKQKVQIASLREAKSKIQKLTQLRLKDKATLSDIRFQNRKLKREKKALEKSRDNWKEKNTKRRLENKQLTAKVKRLEKAKRHQYELWKVDLCVKLRLLAGCSYRCICRILLILDMSFHLSCGEYPCANTIQNWVSKVGLYRLKYADNELDGEKVCLIIDESIRLGNEKLLLILACRADKVKQGGLSYEDVEVCYMRGSDSWTGEKIQKEVDKLLGDKDYDLDYIVSDQASKMIKAARLLEVSHVPDLSHAIGTCLRRTFEKEDDYKLFIKQIATYQSKGVNRSFSYLCPPKQRSKARFMNQKKIVKWSVSVLGKLNKLCENSKVFFADIVNHKAMIQVLDTCIELAEKVALPLKKKGLSKDTIQAALKIIEEAEKKATGLVQIFIQHFKQYLNDYQVFILKRGGVCQICSDVIESMFGTYKDKVSQNPLMGVTLLSLELPALCMESNELSDTIKTALEDISILDLKKWRQNHSIDNQVVKRRDFHKK